MKHEDITIEAGIKLAQAGEKFAEENNPIPATIATSASALVMALLLLNDTLKALEEIRDALKEGK
jgi:hypothetical protein